jgi:hypothetical protein
LARFWAFGSLSGEQADKEDINEEVGIAARFLLTLLWAFFHWRGPPGAGTAIDGFGGGRQHRS